MFKENLKMALQAIRSHKLRSFLSCLGIFIGVFSIILILSIMDGFKYYVHQQFANLGGSTIYINKTAFIITSREEWIKSMQRKDIDFKVHNAIIEESVLADYVAPLFRTSKFVNEGKESKRYQVTGSNQFQPFVDEIEIDKGRFYTAADVKSGNRVCVIGWDIADYHYPGYVPIGERIKLSGIEYRIIGIYKKRGTVFGNSLDQSIYIPYTSMQGSFRNRRGMTVAVKTENKDLIPALKDELRGIVRKARKVEPLDKDDFALNELNTLSVFFDQITQAVYLTVFFISMICLLVGGVGIMNIMIVSVTERTKEIGIRKSLGAKRKSILSQFLNEAITLSALGGIPGIIFGFGSAFAGMAAFGFDVPLTAKPVLIGFFFSVIVGTISGFFPALRASKMKPVDALAQG
ncbi:MAG: ABC transporter permease [Calditrichaeota bacterium]|nr:ABC transporter permease [Calditrichota bacterium]